MPLPSCKAGTWLHLESFAAFIKMHSVEAAHQAITEMNGMMMGAGRQMIVKSADNDEHEYGGWGRVGGEGCWGLLNHLVPFARCMGHTLHILPTERRNDSHQLC